MTRSARFAFNADLELQTGAGSMLADYARARPPPRAVRGDVPDGRDPHRAGGAAIEHRSSETDRVGGLNVDGGHFGDVRERSY
jgi:hypothetical protein